MFEQVATSESFATTFKHLADMKKQVGKELGLTEWFQITQERIDHFAEVTDDPQWIHTNPELATKYSPYKTTIAHGFLVLSLASKFAFETYHVQDVTMGINYGLDKVRFPNATPVDAFLRGRVSLLEFKEIPRGARYKLNITFEIKGQKRPACVAEFIAIAFAEADKLSAIENLRQAVANNNHNNSHSKKNALSPEHLQRLLLEIEDFLRREVHPIEQTAREKGWNDILPLIEQKRKLVKQKGWWTPQIPKKWGGMGLSLWEFGQLSALLGTSPYGHYVFNTQAPDAGNMEILIEFGTPAQQERFLKPLLSGEIRSCFSMTEPEHAGSNPIYMSTLAVKDGEDYLIDGHKWFTSSADGASFAIVMAITDTEAESPYRRASQIIVPLDNPGVQFVRNIPVMGEKGEGWSSHAELRYENCRVPIKNLLGKEGAGFAIAQTRLGPGRIHHCMRWLGICERAFDLMCQRAATRELEPGVVLAHKQTIQNWIAESRAEMNAGRLMVLKAAKKIDEEGAYAARIEISTIKFYCANVLQKVLDRAIQVHGGLGITEDTLLSWWYRHERGARIYDGADEVHKSSVAKQILKKYGLKI